MTQHLPFIFYHTGLIVWTVFALVPIMMVGLLVWHAALTTWYVRLLVRRGYIRNVKSWLKLWKYVYLDRPKYYADEEGKILVYPGRIVDDTDFTRHPA